MADTENRFVTPVSRDVVGRFVCNTFDEARSTWEDGPGFDAIVIGGGTFGAALASALYFRSEAFVDGGPFAPHNYRVLVLEAGPFVLPEHVQNVPMLMLFAADPTSIQELEPDPALRASIKARREVWGLPWHSNERFPGLAYCVGGRSLYWGGWSPQYLDSEMPTEVSENPWPLSVVDDLKGRFFDEANRQLGSVEANDFVNGALRDAMADRLLTALQKGQVASAIDVDELPLQIKEPPLDGLPEQAQAVELLRRKIDAPYALSTRSRAGFLPVNKFSSVPLLIAASRDAQARSGGKDNGKRLMVVPNCHVTRLDTETERTATGEPILRVKGVETNVGYVPVRRNGPTNGVVVLAAAAVESTRLAQVSFPGLPAASYGLIGKSLMAHTRADVDLRIPRAAMPELADLRFLEVAALQIRGRHEFADGTVGHYHLQITASGTPNGDFNAERELFQKVPDLEDFERFSSGQDDEMINITIRGIAEMQPQNARSFVRLDHEPDEFGIRRAFVAINENERGASAMEALTERDRAVFETMLEAMRQAAKVWDPDFDTPINVNSLGTTHHEAGTLWMGDDPSRSVTNSDGRFHFVTNAFVGDLSVLPTSGSANPMLPGIALARRLAKHLVPEGDGRLEGDTQPPKPIAMPRPVALSELRTDGDGFTRLFGGATAAHWRLAGKGQFFVVGDALQTIGGTDLGLAWCTVPTPPNFLLRLEWLVAPSDGVTVFAENSGVFVRFPHPDSAAYHNPAWVPVDRGFEIQIDPNGRGPDGEIDFPTARTGSIYRLAGPDRPPDAPAGRWNQFEIRVEGERYRVSVNGSAAVDYTNDQAGRGAPTGEGSPSFLGLQLYRGAKAAFRNVLIKAL
jgi:choline dehydrogenase-like flavoprotein